MMPTTSIPNVQEETTMIDWNDYFDDPTRPLVVDLGCGMGVSLMGLASCSNRQNTTASSSLYSSSSAAVPVLDQYVDWEDCNFVGGDLNVGYVRFAKSTSARLGLNHDNNRLDAKKEQQPPRIRQRRLAFGVWSAQDLLDQIHRSYPGPIILIMLQFPTPFASTTHNTTTDMSCDDVNPRNSQLPVDRESGFMVTSSLLESARMVLQKKRQALTAQNDKDMTQSPGSGWILLQSNCEDVAVTMRQMAEQVGFTCMTTPRSKQEDTNVTSSLPQRTRNWIAGGGQRAIGPGWSAEPLLAKHGRTETEVACKDKGTPIHRCFLQR
eukprot:scaffold40852_cov49-Attheya_sp.AAC.2